MRDTGWFKSSRSGGGTDNCVEVRITDGATDVRDSKNSAGGQLILSRTAFTALISAVR